MIITYNYDEIKSETIEITYKELLNVLKEEDTDNFKAWTMYKNKPVLIDIDFVGLNKHNEKSVRLKEKVIR